MPKNLDLGLLRTLIQVADCGSMTSAAGRLHMTQGAVSQRIKRLEQLFGGPLLERSQRGAGLTGAGQRLLDKARQLVALNDDIMATLPLRSVPAAARARVRLGVPHDLIGTHLPALLQEHARRHPEVDVALVPGSSLELRQACDAGKVDLALIEEPAATAGGEPLSLEQPVWVGAADGRAWARRPLPVCLVSPTCVFRQPVDAALAAAGIAARSVADYAGMEATTATVQADLAVSAWLASTVPAAMEILGPDSGLPALPPFAITLYVADNVADNVAANVPADVAVDVAPQMTTNPASQSAAPATLAMAACIRDMYARRRAE